MLPYIIKAGFIIIGFILMSVTFIVYSARRMTVHLAVTWELMGLTGIVIGTVPLFSNWCFLISEGTAAGIFAAAILIIWGGYIMCLMISSLMMKNQELAMQVSLLNQENEKIINELSKLTGKSKQEL